MGILTGALFVGLVGTVTRWFKKDTVDLENFDELIGNIGDPKLVEAALTKLLPEAQKLSNNSIYLQMLSQIALMQAVQKKFDQAHTTLDDAQAQLNATDYVALARILLERGRTFQQQGDIEQAQQYFDQSYQVSKQHNLDYHTINAAHMIAIVVPALDEKIAWNLLALDLALKTHDKKAAQWLAPLHNNLGQNYFDAHNYQKSHEYYEKALELFAGDSRYSDAHKLFARWTIGRCMRALNRLDKALDIQTAILREVQNLEQAKQYGMPAEMFFLIRGFVYEELAYIFMLQEQIHEAKKYAKLALNDLENNEMFITTSPERIKDLKNI